jgi:hypothetical protein
LAALVAEGLTLPQIAGIGHCATSSVRLFLMGSVIPGGPGTRFINGARALRVLRMPGLSPEPNPHKAQADLSAFARRWLDAHSVQGALGMR